MYSPKEPAPFALVEAAKAAFDWGLASEREKFWEMFRVRALEEFGSDVRDELSLYENWDAKKAFACFRSVMSARRFRLGSVTPKRWRSAISSFLKSMAVKGVGKRANYAVSDSFPQELLVNKCYEYESASGILGAASNPFWHKFVEGPEQYRSFLVPDVRKTKAAPVPSIKKGKRTVAVIAGFPIQRESVIRTEAHLVPPELIAALTYGKPGLDFVEYVASN